MPRPRSLTLDAIGAAGLAVVDREGLGALSMRTVAEELGVGTMSLYRYVESRDQIEGLVVDQVVGVIDPTVSTRARWSTRITTIALRMRSAVAAHPGVVPLLLTRRHRTLASLACGEALLAALTDAGLRGRNRTIAFRALLAYVLGAVQAEHLGPLEGEGTAVIAALDPDEYPNLTEAARHARTIDTEAEFRGGLTLLLRGIDPGRAPPASPP